MIKELKSSFSYDPATGHFTWLRGRVGKKAGSISNGYVYLYAGGKSHLAHRVAWLFVHGKWPPKHIDHANRIRTDNRIENLRLCTHAENHRNCPARRNNTTGYKGVSFHKASGKFCARIRMHGKDIYLGLLTSPEDAAAAYNAAATTHFGEFAHLNQIPQSASC